MLGIAITVVAIVVELAANRYTHRITELFVSEPINFLVTGFFVISALQAVFVGLTFETLPGGELGFVPSWGIVVSMSMLALCLLLLLPYFAFVFAFLSPIAIVHRIQRHTLKVIGSDNWTRKWVPSAAGEAEEQTTKNKQKQKQTSKQQASKQTTKQTNKQTNIKKRVDVIQF